MILKSIQIPTSDTAVFAAYVFRKGENETIELVRGSKEDIQIMGAFAKMAGKDSSVRHVIITSKEEMSQDDVDSLIEEFCNEYGVPDGSREQITVVKHEKPREDGKGFEFHWHIAVPEVCTTTGRLLDSRFTKIRDEKLSRIGELKLGHEIVPGRFNKECYTRLSEERDELDLSRYESALRAANKAAGFKEEDWLEFRAFSAYSSDDMKRVDRLLFDGPRLPEVKHQLKEMATTTDSIDEFIENAEAMGYEFQPGKKEGVFMVLAQGVELGAAHRLSGIRKRQLQAALEKRIGANYEQQDENKSHGATRNRKVDQRRHSGERGVQVGAEGHPVGNSGRDAEGGKGRKGRSIPGGSRKSLGLNGRDQQDGQAGGKSPSGAVGRRQSTDRGAKQAGQRNLTSAGFMRQRLALRNALNKFPPPESATIGTYSTSIHFSEIIDPDDPYWREKWSRQQGHITKGGAGR